LLTLDVSDISVLFSLFLFYVVLQVELSFKAGDLIVCYGEMDDDGFYMGEMNGRRGLVPSNFLQESATSDEEVLDSVSVVTPARSGESINTSDSRKSEQSEPHDAKVGECVTWPHWLWLVAWQHPRGSIL